MGTVSAVSRLFQRRIILAIVLIVLGIGVYFIHYLIFRDAHHIFIYLVGDVAFVFFEVLLVTVVIDQLLNQWEKQSALKKMNMVIEVFFSEFGKHLISYLAQFDRNLDTIRGSIIADCECGDFDFKAAFRKIKGYQPDIDVDAIDLTKLEKFLVGKRGFLVGLLQNPNLLEHESFTECLMAIFHITEELAARDLGNLCREDIEHTREDIKRAYNLLIFQWLSYMEYISANFPYFFLFAMRTNPFDEKADWLDRWYHEG